MIADALSYLPGSRFNNLQGKEFIFLTALEDMMTHALGLNLVKALLLQHNMAEGEGANAAKKDESKRELN